MTRRSSCGSLAPGQPAHGQSEDAVVRDELARDLLDQHHVTELDRLGRLPPLQELRVRLKDAEDLLIVGDLLAANDPTPCLAEDLLAQRAKVFDLGGQHLDRDPTGVILTQPCLQTLTHRGNPFQEILDKPDEAVYRAGSNSRAVLTSRHNTR